MNMFEEGSSKCTPLMCVEVTAIVPPRQQALLRTAGSVGAAAYTEVVAQGRSTIHLEYTAPEGEECGPHVPVVLPFTTTEDDPFGARWAVLVVSHDYLVANTPSSALGDLSVHVGVKSVRYVGGDDVVSVGQTTISGEWIRGVTSMEMCGLEGVLSTRNMFLCSFTSLKSIDLSPLRNVTNIGSHFMYNCSALTTIDLSPLSKVTRIGNGFLGACASLTSIYLPSTTTSLSIVQIGTHFMHGCTSLASIDLNPLINVTTVGSHFMSKCTSLRLVDLSPLNNVTVVGSDFFADCEKLVIKTSRGLDGFDGRMSSTLRDAVRCSKRSRTISYIQGMCINALPPIALTYLLYLLLVAP